MSKHTIVPIEAGTLLRMFPDRQTDRPFVKRTSFSGKDTPFEGTPVFEVSSYVLDKEGGHVTFDCGGEGTFWMTGGGHVHYVKFPYPHPMFEIVGEAETQRIKARWAVADKARWEQRRWKWPGWLRMPNWLRFTTTRTAIA